MKFTLNDPQFDAILSSFPFSKDYGLLLTNIVLRGPSSHGITHDLIFYVALSATSHPCGTRAKIIPLFIIFLIVFNRFKSKINSENSIKIPKN